MAPLDGPLLQESLFLARLDEVGVGAGNKNVQSAVIVVPKVPCGLHMAYVFQLVEFVVAEERLYQTLCVEKHVVTTESTSELLEHWDVFDPRAYLI
jgi:hypothetical protein